MTRARIVTASETATETVVAAIEIANVTAIPGARRHAREGRAKAPANRAATAGRAPTTAITVEESIVAKRVEPMGRAAMHRARRDHALRRLAPMDPAPRPRAAMPAAATVGQSGPMHRRVTRAATAPRRRARVSLASALASAPRASAAAVDAGAVAAGAVTAARTRATDS